MQPKSTGSYLAELRKRQQRSLQHVAKRMGRKGLSKQALSLIEKGRMRIPTARLMELKKAYRLSVVEEKELGRLYAFEKLVESTGEDREFGEAVLSVVDPTRATSIYVIGGRKLSLESPVLQERAAEFLERPHNRLVFLYPSCGGFPTMDGSLWFQNTTREMLEIQAAIRKFSRHPMRDRIQFHAIDAYNAGSDPVLLSALSLCNPFMCTTIASLQSPHHVAGYVYVEGPKDHWVLLKSEHAKRIYDLIVILLEKASGSRSIRQKQLP